MILIVGRQLQLEDVCSKFPVDLVEVLGPGVAALDFEPMLHASRDAGLQRVVVRDENRIGEQRSLAHSLNRQPRGHVVDRVRRLPIHRIPRARQQRLIELHLPRSMR